MEIESEDEDDDEFCRVGSGDDGKSLRSGGSFSKTKNMLGLHLTATDSSSAATKKSPVSPYSRQTSSSDSQKSAMSLQPNMNVEWEMPPAAPISNQNGSSLRQQHRRSSVSSCYSITESFSQHEMAALNSSELDVLWMLS